MIIQLCIDRNMTGSGVGLRTQIRTSHKRMEEKIHNTQVK